MIINRAPAALWTLLFCSWVCAPLGLAQQECGTEIPPELVDVAWKLHSVGAYELPPDMGRYLLDVPMAMHIVRRDDGTGGIDPAHVDPTVDAANVHWRATGIRFFRQGAIRYINDSALYDIDNEAEYLLLLQTDVVDDTINVYFVRTLEPGSSSLCGRATFTFVPTEGVVLVNHCTPADGNTITFAHELGHYFDLYHTHETAMGSECPSGVNCAIAGDLVCDTPADPNLGTAGYVDEDTCAYIGGAWMRCPLDGMEIQVYDPDPSNLMSYAFHHCRDLFTSEQRNRALAALIFLRPYLIQGPLLGVTWVDFDHGDSGNGSYSLPYNDLREAVEATLPGGTVVIKASSSPDEVGTFDQPVVLDAFRGVARLGG
jgi:hypothetical protein